MPVPTTRRAGARGTARGAGAAALAPVWGALLEEIAALAAHEVKGALNGVSINLEVVRARAAQPVAPASAVLTFAEVAASQLDLTVRLVEGLLALTRAPRASADIVGTLERLETILGAVARVAGGEIAIEVPDDALAISTGADAGAVRAVLAAVLLEGACDGRRLRCTVLGGETTRLHVRDVGGGAFALPERVAVTASEAGIRVVPAADELILAFPPVAEAREEA